MTPMRTVTSIQTKKAGFYTKVSVFTSGNTIDFKFRHEAAALFRDAIQRLLLDQDGVPAGGSAAVAETPDVADQLAKLGQLRDSGVLTEEEFTNKKAELLARI